jgi:Colicin immunity protein / pyocin immunity protein
MLNRITEKSEMVALVQRIIDIRYAEEELHDLMDQLKRSTGCPDVSDLIFWPQRPMTAAEIVDAALAHRPIILGDQT